MTRARFSIGIDLGTTNTALAFVPLEGDLASEMLAIPQVESPISIIEAPTLPSFLYFPEDASDWVIGGFARRQAAQTPGRVVHSAKSWLAHHRADRSAPFLPWGSDELGRDDKISPVAASAFLLGYLRDAWNERFRDAGDDFAFDAQVVTLTVPASFDTVAQRLTLDAAREAGYPQQVRLLEEPQAVFYRWLETCDASSTRWALSAQAEGRPAHVLVVDIGGGTSDFSLFAFRSNAAQPAEPRIERLAVSEHILLGGDNMDLALAHRLEPQLVDADENLSGRPWEYLVARCRDLKEAALATEGSPDDVFAVSIPGRGSRLIVETKSAQLSRADIDRLLLDGFFPECGADEYPIRAKTGLRELGLPYASDPGITRHLADFLRDRPPVDAVLFNGGSLHARRVRERICAQLSKWQAGATPMVLENSEPSLAVARGAARFGKLVRSRARRIEAGAAHAIFLQADRSSGADQQNAARPLICVLPKNAPTEQHFALPDVALDLRVNEPVRFQSYSSARLGTPNAGDIVAWNERDFRPLPPLETSIRVTDRADAAKLHGSTTGPTAPRTLPVRLTARLGELGQLEISCVSADPQIGGSWPLTFHLRALEASATGERSAGADSNAAADAGPNATAAALDAGRTRIETLFGRPITSRDRLTATRLMKSLESLLGLPKAAWNIFLLRSLWSTLQQCMPFRERSVDHEEAWLIFAGFLLRPGFGAAFDEMRIDQLWTLRETGLCFTAKSVKIQAYVLWRRVAGGLSGERQEELLAPELAKLREQSPPPELVLLAGSLERLPLERKAELIDRFAAAAAAFEREGKHHAHFLAALGFLLNRAPFSAGPEHVVPPDLVQQTFEAFTRFDWDGPRRLELQTLFLRAARVVDNRSIDVSRAVRRRIADKLERSGVPPARTAALKDYIPMQRSERAGSFGEALPPGLILRDDPRD